MKLKSNNYNLDVDSDYIDDVKKIVKHGHVITVLFLNHRTLSNTSRLLLFCDKKFVSNAVFINCGLDYYRKEHKEIIDNIADEMIDNYVDICTLKDENDKEYFNPVFHINMWGFELDENKYTEIRENGRIYQDYYIELAVNSINRLSSTLNKESKKTLKKQLIKLIKKI